MRRIITLCLVAMTFATLSAQAQTDNKSMSSMQNTSEMESVNPRMKEKNYNRWSVNLNGGYNVAVGPFTSGYYSARDNYFKNPSFNHVDINVRRMFSTKVGLMAVIGYDRFYNDGISLPFKNYMYTASLQGVLNVHRALNWEEFTNTFGLQVHFGPGFTFLKPQVIGQTFDALQFDNIYTINSGVTLLVKVSDRLALNLDYTINKNFSHNVTIDGKSEVNLIDNRTGIMHNASIGATFYLGKKEKHADWYWENTFQSKDDLLARVNELEAKLKDGNNNGFPDLYENYVNNKIDNSKVVNNGDKNTSNSDAKNMINSQFVNVFFDFDQTKISTGSISAINFLIKYLNENPNAKVDVIGYADELGNKDYNMRLSETRAKNVAEMLVRSGIAESRLNVMYKGEDNSVPKESSLARQLVRRVVFKVE